MGIVYLRQKALDGFLELGRDPRNLPFFEAMGRLVIEFPGHLLNALAEIMSEQYETPYVHEIRYLLVLAMSWVLHMAASTRTAAP